MGDHPDFYIPYSEGTITEQTPGYCREFNFWEEHSIAASASYNFDFTINDEYFLWIPVLVTVSPLANTVFQTQILFAGTTFWYGSAQALVEAEFSGLAGLQLVNGNLIRVTVTNLDASARTFDVAVNGAKILKPMGY
jgi:hypothetical protein